jgi:RNA polymerase sigma-70 factor (ECF subfamily)
MESMKDAQLIKEFRKGNREAFSELVSRHSRPLTMMLLRILKDEEEAKDISQTAFLKAFEGLPRFMMASSFKTWLYRIAINAAKDRLRKRWPTTTLETYETFADPAESPGEKLDKALKLRQVREAVARLPEKQRITLQLRLYEEMDYKQIAEILGGTAGGARGNFFQAVRSLKSTLEQSR